MLYLYCSSSSSSSSSWFHLIFVFYFKVLCRVVQKFHNPWSYVEKINNFYCRCWRLCDVVFCVRFLLLLKDINFIKIILIVFCLGLFDFSIEIKLCFWTNFRKVDFFFDFPSVRISVYILQIEYKRKEFMQLLSNEQQRI